MTKTLPNLSRLRMLVAALFLFLCLPMGQAYGQSGPSPFASRAAELPDLLAGKRSPKGMFSQPFLAQVPPEQFAELARQLVNANGQVKGIARLAPETNYNGVVEVQYERAVVRMQLVTAVPAPNLIIGLLVTAVEPMDKGPRALIGEFKALPGSAGLLVTKLGQGPSIAELEPDRQFAIGSVFKLWVLGEAAHQVQIKQRRWSDVAPLGPPSLPSGITQGWPEKSPMTLHSLATLMISISDNSAADTLLNLLGRANVDESVSRMGHSNAALSTPVFTTNEVFALKMNANADLRESWKRGTLITRRKLLVDAKSRLSAQSIRRQELGEGPRFIDTAEWFATPNDMARMLDWLRLNGGKDALDIMSVNRPLPAEDLNRFRYVGYKGGSEAGVIAMTFLIQNKAGDWYSVSAAWNNPAASIDEKRFAALVTRAVALVP